MSLATIEDASLPGTTLRIDNLIVGTITETSPSADKIVGITGGEYPPPSAPGVIITQSAIQPASRQAELVNITANPNANLAGLDVYTAFPSQTASQIAGDYLPAGQLVARMSGFEYDTGQRFGGSVATRWVQTSGLTLRSDEVQLQTFAIGSTFPAGSASAPFSAPCNGSSLILVSQTSLPPAGVGSGQLLVLTGKGAGTFTLTCIDPKTGVASAPTANISFDFWVINPAPYPPP